SCVILLGAKELDPSGTLPAPAVDPALRREQAARCVGCHASRSMRSRICPKSVGVKWRRRDVSERLGYEMTGTRTRDLTCGSDERLDEGQLAFAVPCDDGLHRGAGWFQAPICDARALQHLQ